MITIRNKLGTLFDRMDKNLNTYKKTPYAYTHHLYTQINITGRSLKFGSCLWTNNGTSVFSSAAQSYFTVSAIELLEIS